MKSGMCWRALAASFAVAGGLAGNLGQVWAGSTGDPCELSLPARQYPGPDRVREVELGDVDNDGHLDAVSVSSVPLSLVVRWGDGRGGFADQASFYSGTGGGSMALLDADGDGDLDPAIADRATNQVYVLNNLGGRVITFGSAYDIGGVASLLLREDVNGDGHHDLIAIDFASETARVLVNDGAGSFIVIGPFGVGQRPMGAETADVTGDGVVDLLVTAQFDRTLNVLPGIGDGSFGLKQEIDLGGSPSGLVVGDLDGDEDQDVICSGGSPPKVHVLFNDGLAGLRAPVRYDVLNGPGRFLLVDLDIDGDPDLLAADFDGLHEFVNDGSGAFGERRVLVSNPASPLDAGDLDEDGRPDVIISESTNFFTVLLNAAAGLRLRSDFVVGERVTGLVVQGLDSEGVSELLVIDTTQSEVAILEQTPEGELQVVTRHDVGQAPIAIELADLDADGVGEVVTANFDGGGVTILNWNRGAGVTRSDYSIGAPCRDVGVADFNGDGALDIVAVAEDGIGYVSVLLGDGSGGLLPGPPVPLNGPRAIAVGDFDADGWSDFAVTSRLGGKQGFSVVRNMSGAGFFEPVFFAAISSEYAIGAADLDADGDLDLVTTTTAGRYTLGIHFNDGDGGFHDQLLQDQLGEDPVAIDLKDVDGDGDVDLLAVNPRGDFASLLLNAGNGRQWEVARYSTGQRPLALLYEDLNRDGCGDLLVANADDGTVGVFYGGGQTSGCLPDLDANGTLNFDDIDAFIAAFLAADLLADIDANGTLNFDDIDAFVASFLAGCP